MMMLGMLAVAWTGMKRDNGMQPGGESQHEEE